MAQPFEIKEVEKAPFFFRVFGWKWKQHAIVEMNNLLARAEHLEEIQVEEVAELFAAYDVSIGQEFFQERTEFFATLLEHSFRDRQLDEVEIQRLKHLRRLLCLRQEDVVSVEQGVAQAVYKKSVVEVLADKSVSEEERAFLQQLQERLHLPLDVAENVYAVEAQALLQGVLDEAVADERLSEEEDQELQILAENLGVNITLGEKTTAVLNKFRLYSQLENGVLPEVDAGIKLPRAEVCHFKTRVGWYEHRRVNRRVGYSGPTVRIRMMKGVYWRAGNLAIQRTSEDVLKLIDSGECFLTNRRIIFRGELVNKTIPLKRIIDLEASANGVQIEKDRGKSPFLQFEPGSDVFAMILDRVIDQIL